MRSLLPLVVLAIILGPAPLLGGAADGPPAGTTAVAIRVLDDTGRPTPARVRITDANGTYHAPRGHRADFGRAYGGDVILDGNRRFAYVEGEFTADLPPGDIRIEVVKGYAFRLVNRSLRITPGMGPAEIRLERWFKFPAEPWYSGDVHVHHISPATALLETKAEDLNVCNILTSDFTRDRQHFTGGPDPRSEPEHIVYVNQEYRMDWLGHVNLLNLRDLVEPVLHQQPHFDPLLSAAADRTHAQGGHVAWAHFAQWPGLEGPLAIVTGKVDSVELLCNLMPFHEPQRQYAHVVPEFHLNPGLRLWYRLLNCGLQVPITAGTDKMSNWVTVGGSRVFARVDGPFTYQRWIDALGAGRTFVSNSPFLFLRVDGREPGEAFELPANRPVSIKAEVWSQLPLDTLEIVANGELIAARPIPRGEEHASLSFEYTPRRSTWIAARAYQYHDKEKMDGVSFGQPRDRGGGPTELNRYYGTLRPMMPFAHTGAIYVRRAGKPIRSLTDAEYYVRYLNNVHTWLDTAGKFSSPEAKQAVLAQFVDGMELFRRLGREDE